MFGVYSRGRDVEFYPRSKLPLPLVTVACTSFTVSTPSRRVCRPVLARCPRPCHARALNARAHVLRPRAKAASAEPHALSNDCLSKTFARAPTLPPPQHNPPAPEKIFALRTSLTPTLRRRLVASMSYRSPWAPHLLSLVTYSWSRTACQRSASLTNTDVILMTERN